MRIKVMYSRLNLMGPTEIVFVRSIILFWSMASRRQPGRFFFLPWLLILAWRLFIFSFVRFSWGMSKLYNSGKHKNVWRITSNTNGTFAIKIKFCLEMLFHLVLGSKVLIIPEVTEIDLLALVNVLDGSYHQLLLCPSPFFPFGYEFWRNEKGADTGKDLPKPTQVPCQKIHNNCKRKAQNSNVSFCFFILFEASGSIRRTRMIHQTLNEE